MEDALQLFIRFLPNLIGFAVILVVGGLLGFGTFWIVRFLVRLLPQPISDPDILRVVRPAIRAFKWLIVAAWAIVVLKLAVGALGIDAVNEPSDALIAFLPKLIVASVVFAPSAMIIGLIWIYAARQDGVCIEVLAASASVVIIFIFVWNTLGQPAKNAVLSLFP